MKKNDFYSPHDLVGAKLERMAELDSVNGGVQAYLQRGIDQAEALFGNAPASDVDKAVAALKDTPKVHIDLSDAIPRLNLQALVEESWPRSGPTDEIASEVKKLKTRKDGSIAEPFVYIDAKKFLPGYAEFDGEREDMSEDECEQSKGFQALAKALGAPNKSSKRLDIVRWSCAFDKYAIGAATVDHQMSLAAAMAHKDICMEVTISI